MHCGISAPRLELFEDVHEFCRRFGPLIGAQGPGQPWIGIGAPRALPILVPPASSPIVAVTARTRSAIVRQSNTLLIVDNEYLNLIRT
jgi:hypothetical protein